MAALKRSLQINGVSGLCITKLDVLDGLAEVRICTGYLVDGQPLDLLPAGADAVARCVPVFETLPGWTVSTVGVNHFSELNPAAQAYLRRIEALTGVPIATIYARGMHQRCDVILKICIHMDRFHSFT